MKNKKQPHIESEEELRAMELDDGIDTKSHIKRHPHEITAPVGEQFIPEELEEQGYTDEGRGTPDNKDAANPNAIDSQKIA